MTDARFSSACAERDMPCAIVTYIGKPTKTKSGDYQKAVAAMQEAMSCLDLIMETSEK